jgi:hypothetical protein
VIFRAFSFMIVIICNNVLEKLLQSFLSMLRTFSSSFEAFSGVWQWSASNSSLFNKIVHDLFKVIGYSEHMLFSDSNGIICAINFAEECTLPQLGIEHTHTHTHTHTQGWCLANFMKLNISKVRLLPSVGKHVFFFPCLWNVWFLYKPDEHHQRPWATTWHQTAFLCTYRQYFLPVPCLFINAVLSDV